MNNCGLSTNVYSLGYVAETMIVNLPIPTTTDVLSVKSISGWIVIHSRDSAEYQMDMTWNDLRVTRNYSDITRYT